MSKIIRIVLLLAVAGGAAWGGWRWFAGEAKPTTFRTAALDAGPLDVTVTATGPLQSVVTVQVGSQVSGRIAELNADFNTAVKKWTPDQGEKNLIAKIDDTIYKAQLDQATASVEIALAGQQTADAAIKTAKAVLDGANTSIKAADAQIASAKAALATAEAGRQSVVENQKRLAAAAKQALQSWERQKKLLPDKLTSAEDVELAETAYTTAQAAVAGGNADILKAESQIAQAKADLEKSEVQKIQAQVDVTKAEAQISQAEAAKADAKAKLQQAQAAQRLAQANVDYTKIGSPIDGVVVSRNVDVGQTVAASLQAPTLFVIANDLTKMQVQALVDESDVGQIHPGQRATFRVDAFPDRTFTGTVNEVRLNAQIVSNVVEYTVIVDVSNPDKILLPGMTANVTFHVATKEKTLRVPNAATRLAQPPPELISKAGTEEMAKAPPRKKAAADGKAAPTFARVWILDPDEPDKLKPVRFRSGLRNGTHTEVLDGALKEGDHVVTGIQGAAKPGPAAANPFGGGAGGGRGR